MPRRPVAMSSTICFLASSVKSRSPSPGPSMAVAAGCTVLVVPCDVEVESGERRIFRDSLVGVDLDVLKALWRNVR